MARLLGHRQTKETETDKPNLMLPRHISTLPTDAGQGNELSIRTVAFLYFFIISSKVTVLLNEKMNM